MKDEQERRLNAAFYAIAHKLIYERCEPKVVPADVIFQLFKDIVEIERLMPDPERQWLKGGSVWPSIARTRSEREKLAIEFRRLIVAGADAADFSTFRRNISKAEIALWQLAVEVLPSYAVGRNPSRDLKIIQSLASGQSLRVVGRKFRVSYECVRDRKETQCAAIAARLKHIMPPIDLWCAMRNLNVAA